MNRLSIQDYGTRKKHQDEELMVKKRILDLFCGGGGAAKGYHLAGFEVVGVDNQPQPHYPFKFVQADALCYAVAFGRQFDLIHASPPCQDYTPAKHIHGRQNWYKQLIPITRRVLEWIGKPYVIENVPGARRDMVNPLMLCGTMFNLQVYRHRYFECKPTIWFAPAVCRHDGETKSSDGLSSFERGAKYITVAGHNFIVDEARQAMGIDWLGQRGLAQAIPPAYTEFIGNQMLGIITP
jgi:DNA (cytosine-5)-methyltransferase 1